MISKGALLMRCRLCLLTGRNHVYDESLEPAVFHDFLHSDHGEGCAVLLVFFVDFTWNYSLNVRKGDRAPHQYCDRSLSRW